MCFERFCFFVKGPNDFMAMSILYRFGKGMSRATFGLCHLCRGVTQKSEMKSCPGHSLSKPVSPEMVDVGSLEGVLQSYREG